MSKIRVGIVQMKVEGEASTNKEKLSNAIHRCQEDGANLVILQELHNTYYFCQTEDVAAFDLSETIPGPSTRYYGDIAKSLNIVLVISLFEKRAPGVYHNTAVVIEQDGSIAGTYRKMHIPDDPAYYEKFYFTPGDLGFRPISTSLGKLGVLVCWDQWYPEAARLMALQGADLLIYPTAIGWDEEDDPMEQKRQLDAWMTVQRSHAVANGIPLVAVNRCGFEKDPSGITSGIHFWGNSFIAGPQGEILYQAGDTEETDHCETIDLSRSEDVRRVWPFLRDRRIDAYTGIEKRWID